MTYAIFKAAGFQYRAELGDVLRLPTLDVESGETVTFDEVLLGASDGETLIGKPTLEGARVQAEVLGHGRADKVIVFKFKRRKNYRRKSGHRQNFTEIRINEIDLGGKHKVTLEKVEKARKPAKKKAKAKAKAKAEVADKPAAEKKAEKPEKTTKTKKSTTAKAKGKAAAKKKESGSKSTKTKAEASSKKKKSGSKSKKKKKES